MWSISSNHQSDAPSALSEPTPEASSVDVSSAQPVGVGRAFIDLLQVVVLAVLLALGLHLFMAQATVVYGQSMQPNLMPAERLVIEKVSYRFHPPARGDIVVMALPEIPELLIKRVVALPGETVEIRDGEVWINGRPLEEPYVFNRDGTWYGPLTLGPDMYFVMGDNRANSNDSRVFGPVPRQAIVGRAWLRYWPLSRFQTFH